MEWIITVAVTGEDGYDIFSAVEDMGQINWTKNQNKKNIKKSDIVYMYVGRPFSQIRYKFVCEEDCVIPGPESDDSSYWNHPKRHDTFGEECILLKALQEINTEELSLSTLCEKGFLKQAIRGVVKSDEHEMFFRYISECFEKHGKKIEQVESTYVTKVNKHPFIPCGDIPDKPLKRKKVAQIKESDRYIRDVKIAKYALHCADYKCEINPDHSSFISKGSKKPYMEPHHLIPISAQQDFENSLDVPANIVSLCSTCHNEIHYGQDAEKLIRRLYDLRKERLQKAGLKISLKKLLEYY